ncbi:T3SS effector guanine exchange factor EspT [Escherichia coli]|uniref:T3SS effector guanine exchange factor EspT n=1 Tax=Escherichia coli TaxID=562 RepID=UPI001299B88C|nr:T3SS effector guanine exchange factor EspT [Escherichia coli]EIV7085024.1 T3SS effector guanine exchange factor EspT [Escherichia coli]MCH6351932.1 T3SS effector guanine exchange factor EspT [Escherichia coli]MDY7467292.1 T3SS effector guanine exchange factor EspT [Escherichia coli]MRF09091.1 secretion protein EspT [Escherichia coli]QTP27573.1 T3SS effector guanine exchange factor EspT [Escherichia coli]
MPGTINSCGFGFSIAKPPNSSGQKPVIDGFFLGTRKISFSYPRLENELIQCINLKNSGKMNEWMREECICFVSRDINKLLDMFAKNNQTSISEGVRERVFQRAGFYCGFTLDVRCAQTSTHHMILNSSYFQRKMDVLLASADVNVRNQCVRTALSGLADTFFESNVNNMDINKFRDRVHNTIVQEIQKTQNVFN